jgi:hypothetical protein
MTTRATRSQLREAALLAGYDQGYPLRELRRLVDLLDLVRDRDARAAERKAHLRELRALEEAKLAELPRVTHSDANGETSHRADVTCPGCRPLADGTTPEAHRGHGCSVDPEDAAKAAAATKILEWRNLTGRTVRVGSQVLEPGETYTFTVSGLA